MKRTDRKFLVDALLFIGMGGTPGLRPRAGSKKEGGPVPRASPSGP